MTRIGSKTEHGGTPGSAAMRASWLVLSMAFGLLTTLGSGGGGGGTTPEPTRFTVGGSISGLVGSLTLRNNGTDTVTRSANGSFSFPTALDNGSSYTVTVATQPPQQLCTVTNGAGTLNGANVTNVQVACGPVPAQTYAVGGSVSGLNGTLVLQNNGGDDATLNADGSFSFATQIADGGTYAVTVRTQPANQTCSVASGSGTVAGGAVSNVQVTCANIPPATYSIGGAVTGLAGTVVLQNNGSDDLTLATNGVFNFATALRDATAFAVTVRTQPAGQSCTVTNGSGTLAGANVTNVAVNCVNTTPTTFTVGGTVSGLTGNVVLQNNGGDDLTRTANGAFTLATALANGAPYNVTVRLQPAGQVCTVTNGPGPVAANVSNVQVACATTQQPLTHKVTLGPDRVRPGEGLVGYIHVANRGTSAVSNVVVQARFPAVGVNNSLSPTLITGGATCPGLCDRNDLVTWNLGTLAAGQGTTLSLPMQVTTGTADGTAIPLAVELLSGGAQVAIESASVTVDADNALSLAVDEDKDTVVPGGTLAYTLSYGNRGATSLSGTTMSLPLPAGVTFVSATGGGTLVGDTVQWTLNTLLAGEPGRQKVVVTVNPSLANGTLLPTGMAQIGGTSAVTGAESAGAMAVTRVRSAPSLDLAMVTDTGPVRAGSGMMTRLTVSNLSGAQVFGTQLVLRMPVDRVDNSLSPTLITGGATCAGLCDRYDLVTWNLGTLNAGAAVTVELPIDITTGSPSGSLVSLAAFVVGDGVSMAQASHTVAIDNDDPLALSVDVDRDAVSPGTTLTYTLTYANRGATSVTGSTLSLPLPPGVTFVSASGTGTLAGNTVQWPLNTLVASQSGRVQVVVDVGAGTPTGALLVVDGAQLTGTTVASGPAVARAALVTRVQAPSLLGLALEAGPSPVRPGETVLAKFTVSNLGASAVFGTTLTVRFPIDSVNNSVSPTLITGGATCAGLCDRYDLVTWSLGTIAAGRSITVQMPMVATTGTASGTLAKLQASVSADGLSASRGSVTFVTDDDSALTLALDDGPDAVTAGSTLTYGLSYGNRTAASITGTTLVLPLPAGTSFVSATGGGTQVGNTVQWTLGSLAAASSGRVTAQAAVGAGASNGTLLVVDAAELAGTSATTGPEKARAATSTRVAANRPLLLDVALSSTTVTSGQNFSATMTVTNNSGTNLLGVVLQVRYPTEGVNNSLSPTLLTGGGTCPGLCDRGDLVTWNLGEMAAGASISVNMPMTVTSGTGAGTLIRVDAELQSDARDDQATASATARVQ